MECPQCRAANPPGAKFCSSCGARLAATCPACGHANPPGSRFCNECGRPLATQAAAPLPERFGPPGAYTPTHLAERIRASRDALPGERKQVTVLFADLKGSLELLADRDPEEARRLLDPVLEHMMEAVHRYEGTVNQVMGDGIMALFGAPLALEDHAVRACYAALRMQAQVGRYGDEVQRAHGVPIQIRVGINSGEVVVRSIGSDLSMEYTALGQTTHLAARMEQMAKPGSVLVATDTVRLAEGYVEVKPLGPVAVRGLAHPVEVFELAGAAASRTRLQVAAGRGLTRFVGRDAEIDQLRRALARAGAGEGQVVAIVGEAGFGKSRLVWELTRSHRIHGWLVLEASAVSYGRSTPWLPVVELLKRYFQIGEADDPRRIREKVAGKLVTLDASLQAALPAFQALFEIPVDDPGWSALDAAARRRRTREAVKGLLLRESQVQPVLLVFEDLHWIDPDTQAVLDGLVEGLPRARVMLLVNYRPEYQHEWLGRSAYTHVRLDPLAPETADDLLQELVGDDGALGPLRRQLTELTQGNPFFLEESVRSLVETGALVGERGRYRLERDLLTVQVPPTVQAVLAARIDRLAPKDKTLLQAAAVIGKDVPRALLEAVAGVAEETLRAGLAGLQAGEFLYEVRAFPEAEYTFKHALTAEVAYASLLLEQRRDLHVRVVTAIERLYPDRLAEHAARLAHHAFRGEAWSKALTYLRETDLEASRSSLDAALQGPESPATLWWTGEHERAVKIAQRDLAVARDFRSFSLSLVALCRLGQAQHALGDYTLAVETFRQAVTSVQGELSRELLGMAGLPSVFARAWLAWCLAERGEFAEGRERGEEAVEIAEAADHAYSRALAAWGLGTLLVVKGDVAGAIPVLERGLVVVRVADIPLLFPFVAGPLGAAYVRAGRTGEAGPLLEQAGQRATRMNLRANHALRLTWLGEAELGEGRTGRAGDRAGEAMALASELGERGNRAYAGRLLAEVAARRDAETSEAAAHYRDALALADELGMRPLAARSHLGLARLFAGSGIRDAASAELDLARAALRALDMSAWLADAEAAQAELEG
jgi:class 3 adenylate cyclase/tetratricopeptide (TPR) repeat protein